jgi:hypothetical protein
MGKESSDFALNIRKQGYPSASASVNNVVDFIYQAIEGRIWYFPEICIGFQKISASKIRINFDHQTKQIAISEWECY